MGESVSIRKKDVAGNRGEVELPCQGAVPKRTKALGDVAAALDAKTNVQLVEALLAQEVDGLHHLKAEGLRLDELQGST
jgi:hypothetical protein